LIIDNYMEKEIEIIEQALNVAAKNGVFTINESMLIGKALQNIKLYISNIELNNKENSVTEKKATK